MVAQLHRPLQLTALFLALIVTALKFAHAATAPAPAPAVEVSATLPGSLGALCVSPQGTLNLTQAATSTSNQLGKGDLSISIPGNLTNSASLQSITNVQYWASNVLERRAALEDCAMTMLQPDLHLHVSVLRGHSSLVDLVHRGQLHVMVAC